MVFNKYVRVKKAAEAWLLRLIFCFVYYSSSEAAAVASCAVVDSCVVCA